MTLHSSHPPSHTEVVAGAPYEFSVMGEDHEARTGEASIEVNQKKRMLGASDFGWPTRAIGSVSRLRTADFFRNGVPVSRATLEPPKKRSHGSYIIC